jgi:hypothetical protein
VEEEILNKCTSFLDKIGYCNECGEFKVVDFNRGTYKCIACCQLEAFKRLYEEGIIKDSIKKDPILLFYDNESEAENILKEIPIPDILKDISNENFMYVKGIFKLPVMNRNEYQYFPAFFI